MDQATAGFVESLLGAGLPGAAILGLCLALWKVHGLYVKAQDARILEGIACVEKLSQAIATLDKFR